MRPRGTRILLEAGAIRCGGAGNFEALVTMLGDELIGICPHRQKLKLLIRPCSTGVLHDGRAGLLRAIGNV